jgi:DNA polymerase III subunit delta'
MKTEIIGHSFQINIIQEAIKKEKELVPFLFSGPEKIGKKTIALHLSSLYLNCQNLNSHPDFVFLEPKEKDSFSSFIGIDQIRDLSLRLSLKPVLAKKIVVVIDEAHTITKEAQNSFLKTLEEPKTKSIIFLISPDSHLMLKTISSRCQEIKFYPVPSELLVDFLRKKNLPKEKIETLVQISQGRPGKLIEYLEGKDKEREYYLSILRKLNLLSFEQRFKILDTIFEKGNLREVLISWLEYGREILIKRQREQKNIEKVKKFLEDLQDLLFSLSSYSLNQKLALENFILKI